MKKEHVLTVLLLSLFRKRLVMIILLVVLPPMLIILSSSLSIDVIETHTERLLEHVSGSAIIISEKVNSPNFCLPIKYGLITVVSQRASLWVQVIAVENITKLKSFTNISLKVAENFCEHTRVSASPTLLEALNITLGGPLKVCVDNRCLTTHVTYSHSRRLESYLIIEDFEEDTRLSSSGFLCVYNARDAGRSIIKSLINELIDFSKSYVLIVFLTYIPILYLADIKLLEELGKELKILGVQGLGISDLCLVFALSVSLITGLVALYSIALSYLIVNAGITVLRILINPVIPVPELHVWYVIPAVVITPLNFLASYLAFRFGGYRVIS